MIDQDLVYPFSVFSCLFHLSRMSSLEGEVFMWLLIMHMPYNILILLNLKLFYKAWSMCLKSIKHVQPCCLSDIQTQAEVQWLYRSILDMIYGRECCCREKFTQIGRVLYIWIQQLIIKHWFLLEFHKIVKSNEQIHTLDQPPFLIFLLKFVPKPHALQIY